MIRRAIVEHAKNQIWCSDVSLVNARKKSAKPRKKSDRNHIPVLKEILQFHSKISFSSGGEIEQNVICHYLAVKSVVTIFQSPYNDINFL